MPLLRARVGVAHAVAKLDQGMLDVTRLLVVVQVFRQKRNGMRTMSHPVVKKRIFWVRDMERLGLSAVSGVLLSFTGWFSPDGWSHKRTAPFQLLRFDQ